MFFATSRLPRASPASGMGKHPATAGEKRGCTSRRVEAKIKRGSRGNLGEIVPEDRMGARAKPKLPLRRRWLPGPAGLCQGPGSTSCPAGGAGHGGPAICFVLVLWGWKSQGKPADEKLTCKTPWAECLAAGSARALPRRDTRVPPRSWALQQFSFYFNFFLPATDFTPSAWKHCWESMYRGMLFCRLFWFSFYFLPATASAGS